MKYDNAILRGERTGMKKIKKYIRKMQSLFMMTWYIIFFNKPYLKEKWILIDSKNGKDLGSNLLRIAEELSHNPSYRSFCIFISCNKDKKTEIKDMLQQYEIHGVKIIKEGGLRYSQVIAMAKYLFTDTSFALWYTKKEGQIITNTWHGTPLKMMGRDVGNRAFDMGNVQKSHLIADYLLYPSNYMKDIMTSAYFLNNLYQGKILCSGYPRNSVFFDKNRSKDIRKKLGLQDKRLYSYMPTWRGVLKQIDSEKNTNQVEYFFVLLDKMLSDDEIFFVRLHPFINNTIDYSIYKHIKPFPKGYEPYDILNICDCMVTDYSSVMFDYANSGNKIILFVYDREVYMDERGVYVSMDTFPFPQVRRVEDLLREMRSPKEYDDREFLAKYCTFDEKGTAEKLCRHIIMGEKIYEEIQVSDNGRDNVLIYSGNLAKNGLTTALLNLLANIDLEKRNYYVTFRSASLRKFPERVGRIPKTLGFIPISSNQQKTVGEMIASVLYYSKNYSNSWIKNKLDRYYKRYYQSNFGHCSFSHVIHYAGYEKDIINMFGQAFCKKIIFVHNDMVREIKSKGNQHELSLRRAYHDYDKVVPVTQDIVASTLELGKNEKNIDIVNNCHDYQLVKTRALQDICFQEETESNVGVNTLKAILDSKSRKFITIGRFSEEKGHRMLMEAFDKYYNDNPDSYLIIIGGYGKLYEKTVAEAEMLSSRNQIIIIKSLENPMPILKQCDLFILSSLYEGLGLVLLEADTLGIPVISTDIVGPSGFMKEHGGYLVTPDIEGIYQGMKAFDRGEVKPMHVDYEKYNRNAVQQFEEMFEGES